MKRIINGFEKLSLPQFSQRLELIVTSMTGNAYFTSLQTEVQALGTAATAYKDLVVNAAGRDQQAVIIRDAARSNITNMLHNLGYDITALAKNNEEILASSGFNYTQDRKATPEMQKPAPPRVELGVNNGELYCQTTTQPGLKSVNFYITTNAAALTAGENVTWDIISFNKTKYTFSGLTAGQRYYIRVGLVGVRGQEVISDPVTYIPQ